MQGLAGKAGTWASAGPKRAGDLGVGSEGKGVPYLKVTGAGEDDKGETGPGVLLGGGVVLDFVR